MFMIVHVELHDIGTQIKKLMDNMFENDVKYIQPIHANNEEHECKM